MVSLPTVFVHARAAFESVALLTYLCMYLHKRHKGKIQFILPLLSIHAMQWIIYRNQLHLIPQILVSLVIDFVVVLIYFQGDFRKKAFLLFGFYIVSAASTGIAVGITSFFADISTNDIASLDRYHNHLITILYILIVVFSIFVFEKFRNIENFPLSNPVWLGLLSIPILSLFLVTSLFPFEQRDVENATIEIILWFSLFILLFNFFVFVLYRAICTNITISTRYEWLRESGRRERRHYEELLAIHEKRRDLHHDFSKILLSLSALLTNGKVKKAAEYIHTLHGFFNTQTVQYTGNPQVDSIIMLKLERLKNSQLEVEIQGFLPKELMWDDFDLCRLLGNALDNAAEACMRQGLKGKQISLCFLYGENHLVIEVSNPASKDVDPSYKTTKEDAENHGRGLRIIRDIADLYDGNIIITQKNGKFTLSVLLQSPDNNI